MKEDKRTCEWCGKEIPAYTKVCSYCGKLRKDIYKDKTLCWTFTILFLAPIAGFILAFFRSGSRDINRFLKEFISSNIGMFAIFFMLIFLILSIQYYVRTSKKLGSWIWY